jgi:hypothetical protein
MLNSLIYIVVINELTSAEKKKYAYLQKWESWDGSW